MPEGLKIVCSIILQGGRLRRTGGTPNDTDVVNGLHTILETGLKVFALGIQRKEKFPFRMIPDLKLEFLFLSHDLYFMFLFFAL